jgi:hypothetical protein
LKKLGVKEYCSATKFKCRQLIAQHIGLTAMYERESSVTSATALLKKLNSEIRKIQCFFHSDAFDQMMEVNHLKGRVDHENGNTEKQTWSSLADLYNCLDPDVQVDTFDCDLDKDDHNHLVMTKVTSVSI